MQPRRVYRARSRLGRLVPRFLKRYKRVSSSTTSSRKRRIHRNEEDEWEDIETAGEEGVEEEGCLSTMTAPNSSSLELDQDAAPSEAMPWSAAYPLVIQDEWYNLLPPSTEDVCPTTDTNICVLCSGITLEALKEKQGYAHHRCGRDLFRSQDGTAGCPFCALISKAMRPAYLKNLQRMDFNRLMKQDDRPVILFTSSFRAIHIRRQINPLRIDDPEYFLPLTSSLFVYTRHDRPNYGLTDRHLPCKDLPDTGRLLMRWMKNCMLTHTECRRTGDILLPSRLIDVGSSADHAYEPFLWVNPRSCSSASSESSAFTPERGVYIALSYCWGKESFLRTTPSTLEERKKAIPMNLMPATIRDAITVTRLLGIRFLWVDAFCILQGDSEEAHQDWIIESTKMESIYSQAFLTIGAAYGSGAQSGLFMRPLTPTLPYVRLPTQWAGASSPGPMYASHESHNMYGFPDLLHPDTNLEINKRAWTLQEKILSARMVQFRGDQLSFECQHGTEYERGDPVAELHRRSESETQRVKEGLQVERLYEKWTSVVENYSSRELTFGSDKLSAIAGVAKRFASEFDDPDGYIGGMWKDSLGYGLLWFARDQGLKAPFLVSPLSCAPTWSWASFSGSVRIVHRRLSAETIRRDNIHFKVLKFENRPDDPFSSVTKAKMLVVGSLVRSKIMYLPTKDLIPIYYLHDEKAAWPHNRLGVAMMDYPTALEELSEAQQESPRYGQVKILQVHCLPLRDCAGLLLRPSGTADNEYVRVGMSTLDEKMPWSGYPKVRITII